MGWVHLSSRGTGQARAWKGASKTSTWVCHKYWHATQGRQISSAIEGKFWTITFETFEKIICLVSMQNCLHLQLCALHFLRLSRQFSDDFVRRRNRSVSQHKVSNLNNGLCRLRYSLNLYSLVTLFREFILRRLRHWCGWLYRKVFHQVFGHANAGFECTRAKNNQGKSKL